MVLEGFDFQPTTRVVFGVGALDRLGELAAELGRRRALVVTDRGILATGHIDRGVASLARAKIEASVFDGVEENPSTKHVARCVDAARAAGADLLVGLGGGSSMDCAKGANFILSNGGRMADYRGIGKATKAMLPMIAVPTTAGTGSEAQSFALIADEVTHQKMACGDKKASCKVAILDPKVTVSLPPKITAVVGVDAVAHAVESYVCKKRNALSSLFARNAWGLLATNYTRVLNDPQSLEARGSMLLGANFSGAAIEHSMLGAAHSAANPLTAHFNVTHGIAVGVMLPWVVRFNAAVCEKWYAELVGDPTIEGAGERLAGRLVAMLRLAKMPLTLTECGVSRDAASMLAQEAAQQWTAAFNPRPVTEADFEELYLAAM
jgi:alcohol dehydrogenase